MSSTILTSPAKLSPENLDSALVRKLLTYRDGAVYWNNRPRSMFTSGRSWRTWNARYEGKRAGCEAEKGGGLRYRVLGINNILHPEHRIILLWHGVVTGAGMHVDHIDGDTLNNRIENLRAVTPSENHRNQKLSVQTSSGLGGVSYVPSRRKWRVALAGGVPNKFQHVGYFDTLLDAAAARFNFAEKHGYTRRHGRC